MSVLVVGSIGLDTVKTPVEEHANLLGDVRLSSPLTGRAVSLQERQMEVMRDKYRALELRMADLSDTRLIELSRSLAEKLWQSDPYLRKPEHAALRERMRLFWQQFMPH